MFGLEVRRICKASHITIILFLQEHVIFYDNFWLLHNLFGHIMTWMFGLKVRRICKASHITIILFLPERVIFYDKQNPAREKKCQFTSSQPLRSKKKSTQISTKLLSFLDFEKLDSSLIITRTRFSWSSILSLKLL